MRGQLLSDVVVPYGIHDDSRALRLHARVVQGFTVEEAEAQLASVGLPPGLLPSLVGRDARTIRTKQAKGQRLERRDSGDLVEIVRLHQYALRVLGKLEYVREWFASPHPSLGDVAPEQVARDAYGRSLVRDVLGRIEHGVYG